MKLDRQTADNETKTPIKEPQSTVFDLYIRITIQYFPDLETDYGKEARDCGFQGLDRTQACSCTSLATQQASRCPLVTYWNFI